MLVFLFLREGFSFIFRELHESIARHFSLTVCTNNHAKAGNDVINIDIASHADTLRDSTDLTIRGCREVLVFYPVTLNLEVLAFLWVET